MKEIDINIVIPCFNRPKELDFLLYSIKKSIKKSKNCTISKIIVSDDSANDSIKKLINEHHNDAQWVNGPKKGPAANRNAGAKVTTSSCEWIIFIDDDCYVQENFISSYVTMMQDEKNSVLEGKIVCPNKKNSIFLRQPENHNGGVLASANFSIKKSLFNQLDGFDEEFEIMEDIEFASRLKSLGKSFTFCENAIAYHPNQPKDISYYLNWIFHFKWQVLLEYKSNGKNPHQFFIKSAFNVIFNHLVFLTRITYHLFTKFDKDRWLMYTFERLLAWISLPISIPHLIYWDFIFRRKIKNRLNN